jgi:hypothetical protein
VTVDRPQVSSELTALDLEAIGAVAQAWAMLDVALRALLACTAGPSSNESSLQRIREIPSHGQLIAELSHAGSSLSPELSRRVERVLSEVGRGRNEGLYGQRNQLLHGVVWKSSRGQVILRRIGHNVPDINTHAIDDWANMLCINIQIQFLEIISLTVDLGHPQTMIVDFSKPQ